MHSLNQTKTLPSRSKCGRRIMRDFGLIVVFFAFICLACAAAIEPTSEQLEFFEKKIRPVLSERCYKCHSVQSEKLKGGLLLDSFEGLMKGGEDGPVYTPDHPEKSRLIEALEYQNPDLQMPPKGKLPKDQIAAFAEWIKMGAPWPKEEAPKRAEAVKTPSFDLEQRRREHWAWQPIKAGQPPNVKNLGWPANPVDRFILARLEQNDLHPALPADRRTLIRRVYFDLIGLPPQPKEVEDFLQDKSAGAYEKVVDRLLASPRFGERWARHWLDLVRYAETLGHEFDYPLQHAWRYRDYVIRAFNADVPYDQFVMEHIAGDLLPNPRKHPTEDFNESVIGTGFYWLGQRVHSPVDIRQDESDVIDNQIDVLSKTFLGMTVACARCHDHKFDAIAAKDYYALYGVLESSHYAQRSIDPPDKIAPKIEKLKELKKQIRQEAVSAWSRNSEDITKGLMVMTKPASGSNADLLRRWSKAFEDKAISDPGHPLYAWIKSVGTNGAVTPEVFKERWNALVKESIPPTIADTNYQLFADFSRPDYDGWFPDGDAFLAGVGGEGDFIVGDSNRPVAAILHEPSADDSVLSRRLEGALRSPIFEIKHRYIHILAAGQQSRIKVCVDNFTMIRDPIYGGLKKYLSSDTPAWLTFDLSMWQGHHAHIELCDVSTADTADEKEKDGTNGYLSASRVLFSDQSSPPVVTTPPTWSLLLGPAPVDSIQSLAQRYANAFHQAIQTWSSNPAHPSSAEEAQLAYLDWLARNDLLKTASGRRLQELTAAYQQLESSVPEPVMVPAMADGNGVNEHVFLRGSYKTPGDLVPRQFLSALANEKSNPFKNGSGRLELARCVIDSSNPLLSRVMVNRVWLHLFGRGIVSTPDDFGALGQPPTHPELLDWLANWYRTEADFSTKKLIRLLVTSSAYRMSSQPADALAEEKDAGNLLLHRMPVRRLEGEVIRDSMLTVSGRLEDTMFGSSVPTYLTEFMEGRGRPAASGPIDGAGRRSIYLEIRRNFISPMMRTFDTPVPFTTIGRRTISNVPAQSLILLNDPFVLGQAQIWAHRMLAGTNATPGQHIAQMYLLAFGRQPSEREVAEALTFLKQQGELYGQAPPACWQDEKVWSDLCHVLFNVKEFVFVE
jgi:hypothetical protein